MPQDRDQKEKDAPSQGEDQDRHTKDRQDHEPNQRNDNQRNPDDRQDPRQ